jgi:hypothetical protein
VRIWRVCLSGIGRKEPQAYRKNLKWLVGADTAESAVQLAMKYATGESEMVQVTIWSVEFIGELVVEQSKK